MINYTNFRNLQATCALLSFVILVTSFYLQYVVNLSPCLLCIMQRICVFILLGLSLISIYARSRVFTVLMQIFFSILGLFFAGRQLWLQSLPTDHIASCLPEFDILIQYFSWNDIISAFFWGTEECGKITWQWLGLTISAWSALYFIFLLIISSFLFISFLHKKPQINQKNDLS